MQFVSCNPATTKDVLKLYVIFQNHLIFKEFVRKSDES